MNLHKRHLSFLIALTLIAGIGGDNATAQEVSSEVKTKPTKAKVPPRDMLIEFTQKAVLKNPDVLLRWHNLQAAISEKSAAQGGYFPRVDISADTGREDGRTLSGADYYNSNTKNKSITLTQMLYDGFATRDEVRRLNNAQLARYYELLDASETASLEAIRAFYDVSRQRELFELTEENYVRHRTAFEQIKLKVAAGVGRRVDLEQAAGRLALSESNLTIDNANVHDVSARFQRIIGELPPEKMRKSPTQSKLAKQIMPNAASAMLSVAIDYHPAILAAIESVRSAQFDANARSAKYQPTINLVLSKNQGTNPTYSPFETGTTSAKVTLNWNLFSGGADYARSKQYFSRLDAAKDTRDKTCRDIRMTLAIAYNDIFKLKEQINFLDQHQLSIEKARTAYQKQFDIGQRSLLDLLDTENELYQAKRSYINAEYDLSIAEARTIAGMGKLLSTLGISHLETEDLPELLGATRDAAENCPPEAPDTNIIDKEKLDARAVEEAKAAIEAARLKAEEDAAAERAKLEAEDKSFLMTPGEVEAAKAKSGKDANTPTADPTAKPQTVEEIRAARQKAMEAEKAAEAARYAQLLLEQKSVKKELEQLRAELAAKIEADKIAAEQARQAEETRAARAKAEEAARLKAQEKANESWIHKVMQWFSKTFSSAFTGANSAQGANAPMASPFTAASFAATSQPEASTLLEQRLGVSKKMIASTSKGNVSIQLFYTDDVRQERIERFLIRAKNLGVLSEIYITTEKNGYRVLYGVYVNNEAARAGIAKLPQKYQDTFTLTLRELHAS